MHRNESKTSPFCDDPQNLHTPKNIYFSETPKNNEIRNFEPPKVARAYVCVKILDESTHPPPGILASWPLSCNIAQVLSSWYNVSSTFSRVFGGAQYLGCFGESPGSFQKLPQYVFNDESFLFISIFVCHC